jgi:hypothetical protein
VELTISFDERDIDCLIDSTWRGEVNEISHFLRCSQIMELSSPPIRALPINFWGKEVLPMANLKRFLKKESITFSEHYEVLMRLIEVPL